jgi:hypothetical protein
MSCTEAEIEHGLRLIEDAETKPVRATFVEIDDICRFDSGDGHGPCGQPHTRVFVSFDEKTCGVLAVCSHHADVMQVAIERWRVRNNLPTMASFAKAAKA